MPLTLITSVDDALCERAVLEGVIASARSRVLPTLVCVGPAGPGWLERELAAGAPVGASLSSASRFIAELWEIHGDGRRFAGALSSEIIMKEALFRTDTFGLGASVQSPGLARALLGVAEKRGSLGGSARTDAVARTVSEVLAEYGRLLHERGLISTLEATESLARLRPALQGPLFVVGAESLSREMRHLFVAMSADNDVTLTLTWDPEAPATRGSDLLVQELIDAGAAHTHLDAPSVEGEIAELVSAMRHARQGLMATGAVCLGTAAGGDAEATLIADYARASADEGISAEGIVVVLPHLRDVNSVVRALRSVGLACRIRGSVPLSATPFGRAFRALLTSGEGALRMGISDSDDSAAPCGAHSDLGAAETWRAVADELLLKLNEDSPHESGHGQALSRAAHQAVTRLIAEAAGETSVVVGDLLDAVGRRSAWIDSGTQGVLVCDWNSVSILDPAVAIVAGLSEKDMPVRTADVGVLGDASADSNDPYQATLRFCAIAARTRQRLVLLRQESGADGAPQRASRLWNEVLDAYRPAVPGGLISSPELRRMASSAIEEYAPTLNPGRRADRRIAARTAYGVASLDRIADPSTLMALRRERAYSASEVESYLRCPQRWFWEWVIRPRDVDGVVDARELGLRAHHYLAQFYRRLAEEGALAWKAVERSARATALLDAVVDDEQATPPPRNLPEKLDAARALRWVRNVVEQDIACPAWPITEHVEMAFGGDDGFEFGRHRFRGRIDRIDGAEGNGLVVIDYKSSREVRGFSQFERAGVVQAVIYAAAAEGLLGRPVVASAYRSMSSGAVRGFWRTDLLGEAPRGMRESDGVDGAGAANLRVQTEERVATAISGMKSGAIGRIPVTDGSCVYCPTRAVCESAR